MNFEEANKVVHHVEDEWHYPILTKYGYKAKTPTGVGFVRSYEYEHPTTGRRIKWTTGVNADYWADLGDPGCTGYWATLEQHLQEISG